jgi:hypothetical protein
MELDLRHVKQNGCLNRTLLIIFLTGVLLPGIVLAAFEGGRVGSCYIGAGNTGLVSATDHFPTLTNPAKLAGRSGLRVDLFFREYYGLKSLYQKALDARLTIGRVPLGTAILFYGNNLYQESDIAVSSALEVKGFRAGFAVHWYRLEISGYGSASAMGLTVSGIYKINRLLNVGYCITNINGPRIGSGREKIPGTMELGIEYLPLTEMGLRLEVCKTDGHSFEYRYGIEYAVTRQASLLCGFNDHTESICMGVSVDVRNVHLSYAADYHLILGLSNTVSMGYAF